MTSKKIFPLFFIQLFILGMGGFIVGPLIPLLAYSFRVNLNIIGFALLLNAFGILLTSLLSGIFAERFGKKNIFISGNILFIISFLGLYLSNNFIYFTISYTIFGMSWGLIFVNSISTISDVSQLNTSKAIIRLNMGFILGASLAPILVSIILFLSISWKYLFLFVVLINVILLISILSIKIKSLNNVKNGENFINLFTTNHKLLSNLIIILCGVIVFLQYGTGYAFTSWFTTYFKNLNVSLNLSSLMLSLYILISGLGTCFKSFLVVKFSEKKIILFFSILAFIFLFISFFIDWFVFKFILMLLFSFSSTSIPEISMTVSIKQNPRYSGPITSITMSYGWIGVIIFQYITGYLTENFSSESLIYICLVAIFLSIVFASILNVYYKYSRKVNYKNR